MFTVFIIVYIMRKCMEESEAGAKHLKIIVKKT